jgi:hypothetical protein
MNKAYFSIRTVAAVAMLVFASMTAAQAADLPPGKVTKVNPSDHTFTVHWTSHAKSKRGMAEVAGGQSRERTFKTSAKTTYWKGGTKASWEAVTTGATVIVAAHAEGSDRVADKVQIVPGS